MKPAGSSGGRVSNLPKFSKAARNLKPVDLEHPISWDDLPSVQLETGRDQPLELAPILNHSKKRGRR